MPTGIYLRTNKHSFNLGKKHPNRKKYYKGKTVYRKICLFCKNGYIANYKNHLKSKFCSLSCSAKNRPKVKGFKQSERQKQMMRDKRGELHPRWIKDRTISIEKHRLRGTQEWNNWRMSIFTRDKFTCQDCKQVGGKLEPHHIIPLRIDMTKIFDVGNGITLCRACHVLTILNEEKFIEKYLNILTRSQRIEG